MKRIDTPIADLCIIEPQLFGDERGFFYESYNAEKFATLGIVTQFLQDNHSFSTAGVLRGVHFQLPPKPMAKLVRCTRGRLWDVAVDLRKTSPTYLQWFGVELSAENKKMLYIPEGFGHGFYAFEDAELLYKTSNVFDGSLDSGIAWNDPQVAIQWPIPGEVTPILSAKDQQLPLLSARPLPF